MLKVTNLQKRFGSQVVLDNLMCHVRKGERVIILGQNGAGKTTLLRCILGLYRPDKGSVTIDGFSPISARKKCLSKIAFIPQLPPPLPFTVEDLLAYATATGGCQKKNILEFGDRFGLDIQAQYAKPFAKLSGGMKQKVLASIAFAKKAPLMLFDEPTANLDQGGRQTFSEIIRAEDFTECTMVFISHRIDELNTVLNRAIWLDFGRIVKDEKINQDS